MSKIHLPFTDLVLSGPMLAFIGSRPGVGRTQYLLLAIRENLRRMDHEITCRAYFPFQRQAPLRAQLQRHDLYESENLLINLDLFANWDELHQKLEEDIQRYKPWFIVIDGLEKIATPSSYNDHFNSIIKGLYLFTEKHQIPILCTAFLIALSEERGGGSYPLLTDFSSPGIEQFADLILGLYRPSYYGLEIDEVGENVEDHAYLLTLKSNLPAKKRYDFFYDERSCRFSATKPQ